VGFWKEHNYFPSVEFSERKSQLEQRYWELRNAIVEYDSSKHLPASLEEMNHAYENDSTLRDTDKRCLDGAIENAVLWRLRYQDLQNSLKE